jgi:WD40 repeat protein
MSSFTVAHTHSSDAAVLCMAAADEKALAVASSKRQISILDFTTLKPIHELKEAHTDRVNELCFSGPTTLYSASSDGSVCIWDVARRPTAPVGTVRCPSKEVRMAGGSNGTTEEAWSVSADGQLIAVGTETAVLVWDARKLASPLATYEVHTEAVTQVRFRPGGHGVLLSGSVDELVCEVDCRISDEEEAVTNILNTEGPVEALGFFGDGLAHAYVLSSTDVLSTWSLEASERVACHDHLVGHKSADWLAEAEDSGRRGAAPVDFVVGCQWDPSIDRLLLLGGDKTGAVRCFGVPSGGGDDGGVELLHELDGAHSDAVRCFTCAPGLSTIVTGAEDARICAWAPSAAAAPAAATATTTASMAAPGGHAHGGHAPGKAKTQSSKAKEEKRKTKPYDKPAAGSGGKQAVYTRFE